MYWPLVTLAFLVPARRAVVVAACVPWASACLTGMPLLWPPFAAVLSAELAVQVGALGVGRALLARRGAPSAGAVFGLLAVVLCAGRVLHAGLVGFVARAFPQLPAAAAAAASFLAGWPGVLVMLVFVPVFVGAQARRDGLCEVRFLEALRRLRLPEGAVLVCAQALRWFEALGRDAEMLARALELRRAARGGDAAREGAAVRVRNLVVRYPGASEAALDLAALDVAPGARVALLGPNGSGKTTLLSVLAGGADYAGDVEVQGFAPRGRTRREVLRRVGVLFENPDDQFLFPTVREDVGWALARRGLPREEVRRRVDALLAALGLPAGNRPVAALSRGQRQRVALAGVLAAAPALLLLDEPTAALDDAEKARLVDALRASRATMLVATHDRAFAEALGARPLDFPPRNRVY